MSETETRGEKTQSLVPENAAQVGGHSGAAALLFRDGRVLKPTTTCPREAAFYRAVLAGAVPAGLTPRCYGFEDITDARYGTQTYVVMEDVTRRFRRPCILDLKIGTQTWDADCSPAKLAGRLASHHTPPTHHTSPFSHMPTVQTDKRRDEETTTATLGFRFCGMRVWDSAAGASVRYAKDYGWTCFGDAAMAAALRVFVVDAAGRVRTAVVRAFLERLRAIRAFVAQGLWTLYASSVLFVYEGDAAAAADAPPPTACMIDFAHSWPVCLATRSPPPPPLFFFGRRFFSLTGMFLFFWLARVLSARGRRQGQCRQQVPGGARQRGAVLCDAHRGRRRLVLTTEMRDGKKQKRKSEEGNGRAVLSSGRS